MTAAFRDRYRMAFLAWLSTVLMSFAFFPALSEKGFVFAGAFFSFLVVLVGVGLRAVRAPSLLVLALQLVALVELLLIFYGESMKYLVFPTGATFDALNTELSEAMDVAQKYAAPAPPSPGLTLMVVFYIALIAILVDFLAVTLHRVPLAGLPLLALYSVPVASLPHGVSFLGFLPGAIGFIAMLMVDERDRLAHWGRLVARDLSPDPDTTIDTSGLAATGRRISSLALATAVVIPIFIPVFSNTLLNGPGAGTGNGGDTLSFSDPMVSLANSLKRKDPVDILRVTGDHAADVPATRRARRTRPDSWAVSADLAVRDDAGELGAAGARPGSTTTSPPPATPCGSTRPRVPRRQRLAAGPVRRTQRQRDGDWSYVPAVPGRHRQHPTWPPPASDVRRSPTTRSTPTAEQLRGGRIAARGHRAAATGRCRPACRRSSPRRRAPSRPARTRHTTRRVALQNFFRDPTQFDLRPRRRLRLRLRGHGEVPRPAARILPALRRHHGDDGAGARYPGPCRGRVPAARTRRRRCLGAHVAQRARVAGALLRGSRLGTLRADPGRGRSAPVVRAPHRQQQHRLAVGGTDAGADHHRPRVRGDQSTRRPRPRPAAAKVATADPRSRRAGGWPASCSRSRSRPPPSPGSWSAGGG